MKTESIRRATLEVVGPLVDLHPSLMKRLEVLLKEGLDSARVGSGVVLFRGSLDPLREATASLPTERRRQLEATVGDDPVLDFVYAEVAEELEQRYKYQKEAPPVPLRSLEAFQTPAFDEKLLASFATLPWSYRFLIRLPQMDPEKIQQVLSAGFVNLGTGARIVTGAHLVDGDKLPDAPPPDYESGGFASLFLRNRAKELPHLPESNLFLELRSAGYASRWLFSALERDVMLNARAFLGMLLALHVLEFRSRFLPTNLEGEAYVYKETDPSCSFVGRKNFAISHRNLIDKLAWNSDDKSVVMLRRFLSGLDAVVSKAPKETVDRLLRAAQWFFDGTATDDEVLSFVQIMTCVEILAGDKASTDEVGLTVLLSNRCAYMLAASHKEREHLVHQFREIYTTRSRIVHSGHSAFGKTEREHYWQLRELVRRLLVKEFLLMYGDA